MTTYVAIADADVDPESPITTTLLTRMRDNAIAIGEADSTAPDTAKFGKLIGLTIITATNATWIPNSKTKKMVVKVVGGGGAGGGFTGATGGGLGGKAGAVKVGVSTSVSGTYAATIGTGGTGVSAGTGGNGVASSFIGTGLSVTANGGEGNFGVSGFGAGCAGDSCVDIGGGRQATANTNGNNAPANSGAGGGGSRSTVSATTGGDGGSGIIYVWEYT